MSILKFEPNVPLRLALKYPNGKRVPNQFKPGEKQVMYSFTDGSLGYFPLTVEEQITALEIRKGQEIEITRSQSNGKTEWKVARIAKPQLVTKLLDNSDLEEYPEQTPRKPPTTQLANALKTALHAAKEAEAYSVDIGHPIQFDKDDIRAMANTLMMNGANGRAA